MNKLVLLLLVALAMSVFSVNALPVTYTGSLITEGSLVTNLNLTFNSSEGSYSVLVNDSYLLNVVAPEGSSVSVYAGGELLTTLTQPPMASVVHEDFVWPLQPGGAYCSEDRFCANNDCCLHSGATNRYTCGSCVYPDPTPSPSTGSGSAGGGFVMPSTSNGSVDVGVGEVINDDSFINESQVLNNSSDNEFIPEEHAGTENDDLSIITTNSSFVNSTDPGHWWSFISDKGVVWLVNVVGSLLLLLLLFFYIKNDDEKGEL